MIGTVVAAVVSALLTSLFWKLYHDKILTELFAAGWDKGSDAYQEGWDNGHLEGLAEGHRKAMEAKKAPVKKAKKISPKGD